MHYASRLALILLSAAWGSAQDPLQLLGALGNRPVLPLAGEGDPSTARLGVQSDALPPTQRQEEPPSGTAPSAQALQERLDREIARAKAAEKGPRRFAADLFEVRQAGTSPTEGGISEDYVLGTGDRLRMSVFGSANFEAPLAVDGRGCLVLPRIGTVQVAGMTLGKARLAVEALVRRLYSRSTVDLSVSRLREVRVFVLGEVYRPGGFLVPNLTSIINVLSLSGGPTPAGSFRRIRILRGGQVVRAVDLYPLRADGTGNFNFAFQGGDTVYVPLQENVVRLEGAFTRVAATVPEERQRGTGSDTPEQVALKRQIRRLEIALALPPSGGSPLDLLPGSAPPSETKPAGSGQGDAPEGSRPLAGGAKAGAPASASSALPAPDLPSGPPALLEENLEFLKRKLLLSKTRARGDKRVGEEEGAEDLAGQPAWLSQWLSEGRAPAMLFELVPGETVRDAIRFAGGLALQSFAECVSLKRISATGALEVLQVPAGEAMARTALERGDVLTALPLRSGRERSVTVGGWARVQGVLARAEGMRVRELLTTYALLLPDTYLGRGEIVRTTANQGRQYLAFDVAKALEGEEASNLLLQDRDEVELYRVGDLRLPRTLTVLGPVGRPGTYEFLEGMRASDLLFRAGAPLLNADTLVAELSHYRDGRPGGVTRLDLTRLLSTDQGSPVELRDDAVNPLLQPFDQISVYARPDFKAHRVIRISGQVARPGDYELDRPGLTLREVLERAGGLTPEAMPSGGIYLRALRTVEADKGKPSALAGVEISDPATHGINEILSRLNETKRFGVTGNLLVNPLLHGLSSGNLNRLIVDFPRLLAGDPAAELELQDGDEVIFPRRTDVAYVVGETASPFGAYKVSKGMKAGDILALAGGPTRNADTWHIRLLKADGRILDRGVKRQVMEPGDALLVPQRIRRDVVWQENLAALTPLAVLINAVRR